VSRLPRVPRIVQALLAVLAGVVIGLVWLAVSDDGTTVRPQQAVEITTDITPDAHVFGQTVVATAEVLVDTADIDPRSVRAEVDFTPYEQAGPRTVERRSSGGVGHVVFRFPLRCLKEGCDTSTARGLAELETGRIVYRFRSGSGDAFAALDWPPFEVASRVSGDDVEQIRWRAAETALPDVTYRADPTWLAAILLAAAAVAAAGAAFLASRVWKEHPTEVAPATAAPVATPLQRALALAREASLDGDTPRRRKALERVALELGVVNQPELAAEARKLAWSSDGSGREEVESLARRAEENGS
jgi:hypothetical protein